jgi:hypothetical protein
MTVAEVLHRIRQQLPEAPADANVCLRWLMRECAALEDDRLLAHDHHYERWFKLNGAWCLLQEAMKGECEGGDDGAVSLAG